MPVFPASCLLLLISHFLLPTVYRLLPIYYAARTGFMRLCLLGTAFSPPPLLLLFLLLFLIQLLVRLLLLLLILLLLLLKLLELLLLLQALRLAVAGPLSSLPAEWFTTH